MYESEGIENKKNIGERWGERGRVRERGGGDR